MTDRVKVFLSYRRADTQHVAGRVGDRLGEQFELFMDIDTIPPGVDFTDYVRRAVGSCDVLLAFIGDRWVSLTDDQGRRRIDDPTDWVVEEISVALKRGVRVIPVLVENAMMPTAAELPESLQALVNRQALPLRHSSFSADMARLIAGIEHAGARRPPSPALATAGPAPVEPPAAEQFADRWDSGQPHAATPASLPLRIPNQAPPRRRLIIGIAIIVVAALIGAVIAIARPFDRPAASGPSSDAAPAPSSAGTPGGVEPGLHPGHRRRDVAGAHPAQPQPNVPHPRTDLDDPAGRTVGGRPVRAGPGRHLRSESRLLLLLRLRHPRGGDHGVPRLLRPGHAAGRRLHLRSRRTPLRARRQPAARCVATPTARTTGSSPGPPTDSASSRRRPTAP